MRNTNVKWDFIGQEEKDFIYNNLKPLKRVVKYWS